MADLISNIKQNVFYQTEPMFVGRLLLERPKLDIQPQLLANCFYLLAVSLDQFISYH